MLVILALSVFGFANAQKGTILVGGNISYASEKYEYQNGEEKTNEFSFSPKVGYQFNDNWTVGGEFTVGSSKEDFDGGDKIKDNDFRLGAFLRYSVPLNQTFSAFADFGLGFQNQKRKEYDNGNLVSKSKADGMYVGVTPALFINMKKGFGLNFNIGGLGYETLSFDNNGPDYSEFYFNFGQTINIGVSKNF